MIRKKWSLEGFLVSNDAMFSKSLWDKVYTDWGGEAAAGQQETQTWVRSGNCVDKYYKYYTKNCF